VNQLDDEIENDLQHYRELSRQLQKALADSLKPMKLKPLPLPADIAELFCIECEQFIGTAGCPQHPRQERLL
jgi:hypothetical protein